MRHYAKTWRQCWPPGKNIKSTAELCRAETRQSEETGEVEWGDDRDDGCRCNPEPAAAPTYTVVMEEIDCNTPIAVWRIGGAEAILWPK